MSLDDQMRPHQPSLFEPDASFPRAKLAVAVQQLAKQNVWIGTSSWRDEGWLDQIYTPERYMVRGRFSKRKFHDECIQEYAETFPVVGGDFSFYSIPDRTFSKASYAEPAAFFDEHV